MGTAIAVLFQSPIGWGLSCEDCRVHWQRKDSRVSIPYWLGSKLRDPMKKGGDEMDTGFNPLLVGV